MDVVFVANASTILYYNQLSVRKLTKEVKLDFSKEKKKIQGNQKDMKWSIRSTIRITNYVYIPESITTAPVPL